jgi:hypothetical protein
MQTLPNPMNMDKSTFQVHEIRRMTRKLLVRMMLTARSEPHEGNEVIPPGYSELSKYIQSVLHKVN